jgi:hypothetical protein
LVAARRVHPLELTLSGLGLPVEHIPDGPIDAGRAELLWIWGAPGWYPRALRSVLGMPRRLRPTVILWHVEPIPMPAASGLPRQALHARELAKIVLRDKRVADPYSNLRRLVRLAQSGFPDLLLVPYEASGETLAEHGLAAHVVPIGSRPDHCRDLGLERDIPVLFIGSLDVPRRKKLLRRLRARGVSVEAVGSWSDPQFYGEARTRLLNRVRILLNLSRFPGQNSGHRLLIGMASRTLVVSEPIYRPDPFVPGTHYVSATVDEMPGVITHFLEHESERQAIAERGHRFVRDELTMESSIRRIAELVDAHGR